MALGIGDRLGAYRIVGEIGSGGMGVVYRARDTTLNRDVAVKTLPDLSAQDADRVARFTREAQTLAALNHPNIAAIFGVEQAGSVRALVMELVEGEDLSARIGRGPVPLDEALPIARQIAEALEAAHDQNFVHRDLKPANIKVRDDGTVKVLDFGIAKALDPAGTPGTGDATRSPTLTARATQMGMILGTAAYMAPEQARGKAVDRRADIWAFGVILYEMLTGRRAFPGDDISDVLASVLKSEPDWEALPARTPAVLRRLLRRCLEKDPRRRLSAIGDARFDLDDAGTPGTDTAAAPAAPPAAAVSRWRALPWAIAALLGTAVLAQLWISSRPAGSVLPFRFLIEVPVGVTPASVPTVLITADGTRLVYSALKDGQSRLYTQRLGELAATPVPGTEDAGRPFLSPDGRWVGFSTGRKIKKVPIDGGTPVDIATGNWGGGSWGRDDRIVYTRSYQEGLWEVDAAGGPETRLTSPDVAQGELGHWWPQVLPDGDHILFTAYRALGESTIEVFSRRNKTRQVLARGGVNGHYVPTGHLIFAKDEALFVVRMDLASLTTSGGAVPLLPDVAMAHGDAYAAWDVSADGTLVYLPSSSFDAEKDLVFVSRSGEARAALPDPDRYAHPSLSPDGTRVAVDLTRKGTASDVWVFSVASGRGTRITDNPGEDFSPMWTPDGRRLLYVSERPTYELWERDADASQPPHRLLGGDHDRQTGGISPDGRLVAFVASKPDATTLMFASLEGEPNEQPYLSGVLNASKPVFSPDGRWLAYQSDESGRTEVYLQSFPELTRGRWKLSTNGGAEPLWTKGGREIVYRERDAVMALAVNPDRTEIGAPHLLFRGPYVFSTAWNEGRSYDVSKDGERFLMLRESPERQHRRIVVTLNWFEELKEKAAR